MAKMADIQRQIERAKGRPTAAAKTMDRIAKIERRQAAREGKVHIGAYLHPDFKTSIRLVQAQTGMDIQTLLAHALNELFRAHKVPVVEP
jgi:hypothetical protein